MWCSFIRVRPAMTSAGSRAFSCRTPSRGQFTYPPYPSATAPATAMTPPPTRYYSPPATTGYYRPVVYPTATQYGGSPNKQRGKGRGRFDEPSQVILPDSTTLTPPNTLSMKKSSVQVSTASSDHEGMVGCCQLFPEAY